MLAAKKSGTITQPWCSPKAMRNHGLNWFPTRTQPVEPSSYRTWISEIICCGMAHLASKSHQAVWLRESNVISIWRICRSAEFSSALCQTAQGPDSVHGWYTLYSRFLAQFNTVLQSARACSHRAINRSVPLASTCCYSVLTVTVRYVWWPKNPSKVGQIVEKVVGYKLETSCTLC